MLRMFSFLPPIGCYFLAAVVVAATFSVRTIIESAGQPTDPKIFVVGGILAFLLVFAGIQKSAENRENSNRPRVSSQEVMQKLTPGELGKVDSDLEVPSRPHSGPTADSPLGRIRARSGALDF